MFSLFDVTNLNFVITGGLGQIGLKLLDYLENSNSKIVVIDIFSNKKLKLLKKKYSFLNSKKLKILNINICNKKKTENSLKKIIFFLKKIDILINLAAIDRNNKGNFSTNYDFHNFPHEFKKKY